MAVEIATLPEFGPAMAEYQAAKNAAVNAGDQSAIDAAELSWERKKNELFQLAVQRDQDQTKRAAVAEQIAKDYPDAPKEVWENLTDPDKQIQAAKTMQERINAAKQQANPTGESWGAPPGTQAGGTPPADQPKNLYEMDDDQLYDEREKIINRDGPTVMAQGKFKDGVQKNEEFRKAVLAPIVKRFIPGRNPR